MPKVKNSKTSVKITNVFKSRNFTVEEKIWNEFKSFANLYGVTLFDFLHYSLINTIYDMRVANENVPISEVKKNIDAILIEKGLKK